MEDSSSKKMGMLDVASVNIATIFTMALLSTSATVGSLLIFYNCLAALLFLLPTALCASELASRFPDAGIK